MRCGPTSAPTDSTRQETQTKIPSPQHSPPPADRTSTPVVLGEGRPAFEQLMRAGSCRQPGPPRPACGPRRMHPWPREAATFPSKTVPVIGCPARNDNLRAAGVITPESIGWRQPSTRSGISVRDPGELHAGVLQLAGPLAGPAESACGLAAHVGGRCTAGEVYVLAPVHPPRVGAAGVAGEVPGQFPEEPVHDLCLPAVPP